MLQDLRKTIAAATVNRPEHLSLLVLASVLGPNNRDTKNISAKSSKMHIV